MKINIVNYHKDNTSGLLLISDTNNISNNFDNIYIKCNDELIYIYDYFNVQNIYVIERAEGNLLITRPNSCADDGLYFITKIQNDDRSIALFKIYNDESQITSNIDSNDNYIINNKCNHKLYKAGTFKQDLYYCYECGNFIWK